MIKISEYCTFCSDPIQKNSNNNKYIMCIELYSFERYKYSFYMKNYYNGAY